MSTLFFDLSGFRRYLAAHGHLSGIQRVNLMVLAHTAERLGREHVAAAFLDFGTGAHHTLPLTEAPEVLTDLTALARALGLTDAQGRRLPTLAPYIDRAGPYRFHKAIRRLNAALGKERHFRRRGSSRAAWRAALKGPTGPVRTRFETLQSRARPGDTLLALDAAWGEPRIPAMHRAAHAAGLRVVPLIHDLCPLLTPQFFPRLNGQRFEDWLAGTTEHADLFLAISRATAADLRGVLHARGCTTPVREVPLAQARLALPGAPSATTAPAKAATATRAAMSDRVASLSARPFALCVGTLEIRKNLWTLAQAWDRLRADPSLDVPRLVFAGRPGWLNEDFDRLMQATGGLGGWARVIDGPSDDELDQLDRACQFHVCVSRKEGWGLPIGEALAYGKTGVVSGVSSMPEVGGDLVEYCDPTSIASVEAACRKLIADPARRTALEARIAAADLRDWGAVADDLIAALGAARR